MRILCILAVWVATLTCCVRAEPTNAQARIAVLSEDATAAQAGDVLTAVLAKREDIRVFDRTDIARIYHEQALSAANQNRLQVARILGADGLVAASLSATLQATNLTVRLIAVKPGVVLEECSFEWPLKDLEPWAEALSTHLASFRAKLLVLPKDAIPISVLNFRSTVQSEGAEETERQLKLLVIQRLSREPRFFVLDRERMELLGEEKWRDGDESAFWNGSYLLEGILDQNGYSRSNITVNARLAPPKGGQALTFEIREARTNLLSVVNGIAESVGGLLRVGTAAREWNGADEARQFLDEGRWALRWGQYRAAQAAADSAWALGMQEKDCASLRIESRTEELFSLVGRFQVAKRPPDPANIERAARTLELYYDFSRTANSNSFPDATGYHPRNWQDLGLDVLAAASRVLQGFNAAPEQARPCAENLHQVRALSREVEDWLVEHSHGSLGNVWSCQAKWGCFWDEKPEESLARWRSMAAGPAFLLAPEVFWLPPSYDATPRLAGWSEEDRRRLPALWSEFLNDLGRSTNILQQLTARTLSFCEASTPAQISTALEGLITFLTENQAALLKDGPRAYMRTWNLDELIQAKYRSSSNGYEEGRALVEEYRLQYAPKVAEIRHLANFLEQKRCLEQKRPYDFSVFIELFRDQAYTPEQAAELLPLLTGYQSNLLAQAQGQTGPVQFRIKSEASSFDFFCVRPVRQVLASATPSRPSSSGDGPVTGPAPRTAGPAQTKVAESATNIIGIRGFKAISIEPGADGKAGYGAINSHQWVEGKLLLDVESSSAFRSPGHRPNGPSPGFTRSNGLTSLAQPHFMTPRWNQYAVAILDPETGKCDVIPYSRSNSFVNTVPYCHHTLFHGTLFHCEGNQIARYNASTGEWEFLDVGSDDTYQLFTVAGRLYATSSRLICEIVNEGRETRILASTRRYPPVSELDKLGDLRAPFLFEGPKGSLRAYVQNRVYEWDGSDWRPQGELPFWSRPEVSGEGVLFRSGPDGDAAADLRFLPANAAAPELLVYLPPRPGMGMVHHATSGGLAAHFQPRPLWRVSPDLIQGDFSAAVCQSNLYLLLNRCRWLPPAAPNQPLQDRVAAPLGYHAELICFSRESEARESWFLRFDLTQGCPPTVGASLYNNVSSEDILCPWAVCTSNFLCLGLELSRTRNTRNPNVLSTPGVWLIPLSTFEPDRIARRERREREQRVVQQHRLEMLAKYDRNHNGRLDAEEKEAALADPLFIESEIDTIDANHNNVLDLDELAWFDANTNRILDPNEQAGITVAQRLLKRRFLKRFDLNGDGYIDQTEYNEFVGLPRDIVVRGPRVEQLPGATPDGRIEIDKLASLGDRWLLAQLRSYRLEGNVDSQWKAGGTNAAPDPGPLLKLAVEAYWRDPASVTNAPLFPHPPPAPNRLPPGSSNADKAALPSSSGARRTSCATRQSVWLVFPVLCYLKAGQCVYPPCAESHEKNPFIRRGMGAGAKFAARRQSGDAADSDQRLQRHPIRRARRRLEGQHHQPPAGHRCGQRGRRRGCRASRGQIPERPDHVAQPDQSAAG